MMLNLDIIHDNVDLVELTERAGVKLRKTGRGWSGPCPFHDSDGESFSIYHDGNGRKRWHCFSICDTDGDVFDFVAKWKGLPDFTDQLKWLADYARVSLEDLGWTAEGVAAHKEQIARSNLLTRAAHFYEHQLWSNDPKAKRALEYARSREFSDEHIQAAHWGFSASDDALFQAMRKVEKSADFVKLAREIGLIRADKCDFTANREGDQVSPDGWLVYPHYSGGKVVYLSSRAVSEIEHGSKSRNLPGQRQVYRCDLGVDGKTFDNAGLVMVEGPADAETLRAWGWPSLALCGCSVHEENNPALLSYLRRKAEQSTVYIALSHDEAGERGTETLATAIAPTVRVVRWPKDPDQDKSDANDWLQQGATAADCNRLLDESPTWISMLIRRTEADRTEENMRMVAEAFARLNPFAQGMWKKNICRALDINLSDFDAMLRASGEDLEGDLQQSEYCIRSGMMCLATYGEHGRAYRVLSNFAVHITQDVVEDDGEAQERYFAIAGVTNNGKKLPEVEVEASEYHKMGWILPQWGAGAQVSAGSSTNDHLRAAILALSEDVKTRYVYSHLGWRKINGEWRYLSSAGAVGTDGVQVRVIHDLERYRLPMIPEHTQDAARASFRFLDTGDHLVTVPILAAMYLAPLSTIVPPPFTIWLFGTTGSLKSTAVALALSHFGKFAYNTPPASWTGTTNALEKKAFLVKDGPLWIDDYTAQSTISGMREMKRKSDQLLRDWGNRSGRSRMRADLKLRRTFVPRGLIISTAEQLPPGPSIIPRLFAIEISPDSMTRGEGSPLTQAQNEDASLYPHAMAAYLQWIGQQWDSLGERLPAAVREYTDQARNQGSVHLRMPGNVATMQVGWSMMLEFFEQAGILTTEERALWHDIGWGILLKIGNAQHEMIHEENPVDIFFSALRQLFAQGKAYLRWKDNEGGDTPNEYCWPRTREVQCELLGWYDDHFWYLLPRSTYNMVNRFAREGGLVFPDSERGLGVKLVEQKLSLPQGERNTYRMPFTESSKPRVWRVYIPIDDALENNDPSTQPGKSGNEGNSGNEHDR